MKNYLMNAVVYAPEFRSVSFKKTGNSLSKALRNLAIRGLEKDIRDFEDCAFQAGLDGFPEDEAFYLSEAESAQKKLEALLQA